MSISLSTKAKNRYGCATMCGCSSRAIPIGWCQPDSRSVAFAVLDIGEDHIQDHSYFGAIEAEMEKGGREALLDFLLRFDLKSVDLRVIPKTAALLEQKLSSLSPEQGWWLDTLARGELPWGIDEPGRCPACRLFDRYVKHASRHGARRRAIETQLGIFLRRYPPGLNKCEGVLQSLQRRRDDLCARERLRVPGACGVPRGVRQHRPTKTHLGRKGWLVDRADA